MNKYGPVVGIFPVDVLENDLFNIEITTNNPIYWKNEENEEKYFRSLDEYIKAFHLSSNFEKARMMITIRKPQQCFPLNSLEYMILDNPNISLKTDNGEYDLFEKGKDFLESALRRNGINVSVVTRLCSANCKCNSKYQENGISSARMFIDKIGVKRNFHKEFK